MAFDFSYHRSRSWEYYAVYLDRFRGNPSPILEMGSGTGLFLEACRNRGVEAVGVEFEAEGVRVALEKGLDARQHDLRVPLDFFEDECFAAVYCNQVIEHLDDAGQQNVIREAFRLLGPWGQLQINSPCRHFEEARRDPYHINLLTPSELRRKVEAVGFVDCNMGYNRPQEVPEMPSKLVERIWKEYQPDLLAQTASVVAFKPSS